MPVDVHLNSLKEKHGKIEEKLKEAIHSPSTDDLQIVDLKRKKLRLKDEIERLTPARH